MTEQEMENYLAEAIELHNADEDFDLESNIRILTYEEAGIMTYNKGLVLRTPDGDEFQITIVKSR
jgi:hypothetical protein